MLHITKKYTTPQEAGRLFEDNVHELLLSSNETILREKDVRSQYGINNTCIDHLLISNDICICIQDKFESSPSCISKINHFIVCVNNVQEKIQKKCIAIYLSKLKITKNSEESFNEQNNKNKPIHFMNICDENLDILEQKLMKVLYDNNIFLYDGGNACIMLNNYF